MPITRFLPIYFALLLNLIAFNVNALDETVSPVAFGEIDVKIGDKSLTLEHAVTFEQRSRGLMYRRELCKNCGMLFSFRRPLIASIWMKNTYIPLDLAYVDKNGKITGIYALKPHDTDSVYSQDMVLYAIEMNQGWFAANNIRVGDKVSFR